jgi:hypothetical protein
MRPISLRVVFFLQRAAVCKFVQGVLRLVECRLCGSFQVGSATELRDETVPTASSVSINLGSDRSSCGFPPVNDCKNCYLSLVEEEITRLHEYKLERSSIESKRLKLQSLYSGVPDSPRLDQLLRYSTALERTFDRTLGQLERAQRNAPWPAGRGSALGKCHFVAICCTTAGMCAGQNCKTN